MRIDEKLIRRRRRTQGVMWTVFRGASLINASALGLICLFLAWATFPSHKGKENRVRLSALTVWLWAASFSYIQIS